MSEPTGLYSYTMGLTLTKLVPDFHSRPAYSLVDTMEYDLNLPGIVMHQASHAVARDHLRAEIHRILMSFEPHLVELLLKDMQLGRHRQCRE